MSDSGVKIEVHLIQNFAPSNLNRDDTGQPKSATFGGFRRARISSQCSKRSARQLWRERGSASVGERTKLLKQELAPHLRGNGRTEGQIEKALETFLGQFFSKMDGKDNAKTAVLVLVSRQEMDLIKELVDLHWDRLSAGNKVEGKEAKDASAKLGKAEVSADIALFGRMLAEQPGRNTDGSCQVAHPISTHRVDMELDYFTAVDDLNPDDETGAGMIGAVGFNSACYYRYALVDRDQLARNLARKTERANGAWVDFLNAEDYTEADSVIRAFLEAMVYAIPTGKQSSFAAQNLPSFGLFVRRQGGIPISLANAFSTPVRPTRDDDDLVGRSVAALTRHWNEIGRAYGTQGVAVTSCFHVGQADRLGELIDTDKETVQEAIDAVLEDTKGQ